MFEFEARMRQIAHRLRNKFSKKSTKKIENPILANALLNIENRLQGALQFLRRTQIVLSGKKTTLNTLPWFLLIGAKGAGKTTLLANANIKYILDKKQLRENITAIPHSETCDWWISSNAVMVDVPGHYTSYKEKVTTLANRMWQHFLFLLTKEFKRKSLSGIVVAISLSELIHPERANKIVDMLQVRLTELRGKFGTDLPFYFIITKCDLLPGFLEFFNDFSSEELSQAWGVVMPKLQNEEVLHDVFNARFNLLIKRLNKQLIWRLHQERNIYAKSAIKDFPLHVEQVRGALAALLQKLYETENCFYLKGVYLTSALQSKMNESIRPTIFANEFPQALSILNSPTVPPQAYFVKQFLREALRN